MIVFKAGLQVYQKLAFPIQPPNFLHTLQDLYGNNFAGVGSIGIRKCVWGFSYSFRELLVSGLPDDLYYTRVTFVVCFELYLSLIQWHASFSGEYACIDIQYMHFIGLLCWVEDCLLLSIQCTSHYQETN
jgi:hypothetical protein